MKTSTPSTIVTAFVISFISAGVTSAVEPPAPPVITSPANHAAIRRAPVDIRVGVQVVQGYQVQSVQLRANGVPIGYASPTSFFGEWSFPNKCHISIMGAPDGAVKIDYTPPGDEAMFLINGSMTSANTFAGTFIHWPGNGVTNEGDVTAKFSFNSTGMLVVVFKGDAPLGTRNVSGGVSGADTYRFLWSQPRDGTCRLSALASYLPEGSATPLDVASPVVTVKIDLPAMPEIVVQQPAGSTLADGAATRSFGTARVGRPGLTKTFTIRNVGNAPLNLSAITRNGPHAADFILTNPAKSRLSPGSSTTFAVTFKPRATGLRKAAIHLGSNDADENPFDIQLTGQGASR